MRRSAETGHEPSTHAPPRVVIPAASWLIGALLLLHAAQSVRQFPSISGLLDPARPVVMVDHAIHLYHGALGSEFLIKSGRTWGYDPAFMAGYPETPVWDSSSNLAILFQLLAGGGYNPVAYKLGLLAAGMVLLPVAIAAGWAAGVCSRELLASGLLTWLYLWVGFPNSLWLSGLFSFVVASTLAALILGLLVQFDERPTLRHLIVLCTVSALAFWSHVTAPIVLAGGLLGYLAVVRGRHGGKWWASLILAAAFTLIVNLVWLVPLWRFRSIRTGSGFFLTTDSAWHFPTYLVEQPVDGRISLLILVLGSLGLCRWWRIGRVVAAGTFAGSAFTLLALTALGSLWDQTRLLEPLRFRVPLVIVLAIPAGSATVGGLAWIAARAGGGKRGLASATASLLILAAAAWAAIPSTLRGITTLLGERRCLTMKLEPEMLSLVEWVRHETDGSGRILLEDQLRLLEMTDPESVHWTPLLPVLLGDDRRAFIGGLYHGAFILHHEATSCGDFHLAGRPFTDWTPPELEAYFDRYNIGWAVVWSPVARFVLDQFPGAIRVGTLPRHCSPGRPTPAPEAQWQAISRRAGGLLAQRYVLEGGSNYALYRLNRTRQFALAGSVSGMSSRPDRVDLTDVRPDAEGSVLLGLHWIEGLHAEPACPLEPAILLGDPAPFVRLRPARILPRLVLSNGPPRD